MTSEQSIHCNKQHDLFVCPIHKAILGSWQQFTTQGNTNAATGISNIISIAVGLSGGADSITLLHALKQTITSNNLPINLSAIHINHGLSSNANQWQQLCIDLCHTLNVPLEIVSCTISRAGGESLENNARLARYRAFSKSVSKVIALAHQQNDQVETFISQVLRGSDLHNIASMKECSHKNSKLIWRPLINTPRNSIEDYVHRNKLPFVIDESNVNQQFLRNFVRHELLSKICTRDTHALKKIATIIEQLQSKLSLIDELACHDVTSITQTPAAIPKASPKELAASLATTVESITPAIEPSTTHIINHANIPTINCACFLKLSSERQLNALNYYIKQQNFVPPARKALIEFCRQITISTNDKHPSLTLSTKYTLIKHKNYILIKPRGDNLSNS